jgi:hypothetical protein
MARSESSGVITISKANMVTLPIVIVGDAPYVQSRFSQKAMNMMSEKMKAGSTAKKGKQREPRDFDADFEGAKHISEDGWIGIPAAAFRKAMIDVCRAVNFKMTHAKMSVFVEADGIDKVDGMPLVKLVAGEPERVDMPVRNATGVMDIRARPMWRKWGATVRVKFDADQFTASDVVNLLDRAGQQIGVGEGRPFSRDSAGMGFGVFHVSELKEGKGTKGK